MLEHHQSSYLSVRKCNEDYYLFHLVEMFLEKLTAKKHMKPFCTAPEFTAQLNLLLTSESMAPDTIL